MNNGYAAACFVADIASRQLTVSLAVAKSEGAAVNFKNTLTARRRDRMVVQA